MAERDRLIGERDWRRAAGRRFLAAAAVLVAGIVLAVVGGGLLVPGIGVVAVSLVVMMCLVFLEVGYSEDRARAQEERRTPPPPRPKRPRQPRRIRPRR